MNSKPVDTPASGENLSLPEPDPDNITVLTRNLPNKPIIPWNHYDSPWQEEEVKDGEQQAENSEQNDVENQEISEMEQATIEVASELEDEPDTGAIITEVEGEVEKNSAIASSAPQAEIPANELTS